MPSRKSYGSVTKQTTSAGMWAFRIVAAAMIAGMIAIVLYDSYASKKAKTDADHPATEASAEALGSTTEHVERTPPPGIAPPPAEEQPWEANGKAPVPEGHLSAAEVKPPGPEPTLTAPEAIPPPDPLKNEPPKHNPGGVDGDRPPRFVPGATDPE